MGHQIPLYPRSPSAQLKLKVPSSINRQRPSPQEHGKTEGSTGSLCLAVWYLISTHHLLRHRHDYSPDTLQHVNNNHSQKIKLKIVAIAHMAKNCPRFVYSVKCGAVFVKNAFIPACPSGLCADRARYLASFSICVSSGVVKLLLNNSFILP